MKICINLKGIKADVVTFLFFSISISKKFYGRKTDFRVLVRMGQKMENMSLLVNYVLEARGKKDIKANMNTKAICVQGDPKTVQGDP